MTEVEKFLAEYKLVKKRIEGYKHSLKEIEDLKNAERDKMLSAKQIRPDKVKDNSFFDRVSETAAKLIDVYGGQEDNLIKHLSAAYGKMEWIRDTVLASGLSEIELKYIELRYFESATVKDIEERIGYSKSSIYNIRTSALCKIECKLSA